MSDVNSGLPIRSQVPGQANYDDIIVKIGDGTLVSQLLAVDAAGLIGSKTYDKSGVGIDSQTLSTTQWLQVVTPESGPSAPGTASAFASLAGGIYNSTPPTLTNGQQASLQLDSSGRLLVDTSNTDDHNYGAVGANTLRTAAQIGNATGAANFGAGTTTAQTLRVVLPTDQTAIPVTQSGAWTVTQGTSPWVTKDQSDGPVTPGAVASFSSLIGGQYNAALPTLTDGQQSAIQIDSSGRLLVSTVSGDDHNYGVVGATTLRTAAQIGNSTGAADFNNGATGAQTLRVAANLAVAGANVTTANPVPVAIVSTIPGTNVNKYNTSAAVAGGASVNHDYTITAAKTLSARKFWASGSGKIKAEVQTSPDGTTFTTFWVGFNSTATPNISVDLDLLSITDTGTGAKVRIIITNKDVLAQDVYSTISGTES
jgi:hypothetical protein